MLRSIVFLGALAALACGSSEDGNGSGVGGSTSGAGGSGGTGTGGSGGSSSGGASSGGSGGTSGNGGSGGTAGIPLGPAPDWFETQPSGTWIEAPVTNTLSDVDPMLTGAPSGSQGAITNAFAGACVDQAHGELILAANGGHTDYYGNEVYALAIRNETPSWVRLADPTPGSQINYLVSAGNDDHAYLDGHPRAVHGWGRVAFGNGRVWYAGLTGMAAGNAGDSSATYSFDRNAAGEGPFPIASADAPWKFHGLAFDPPPYNTDGWKLEGAPAAYDRTNNRVFAFANWAQLDPDKHFWTVSADDAATVSVFNRNGSKYSGLGNPSLGNWGVHAYGLGGTTPDIVVVCEYNTANVWVVDTAHPEYGMQKRTTTSDDGTPTTHEGGAGGAYLAPARGVFVWGQGFGSSLRKLSIPNDPMNGEWKWSTVAGSGGATPESPTTQVHGKFNVIEDMGNGQAAFVLVTSTTGPVWVYKPN